MKILSAAAIGGGALALTVPAPGLWALGWVGLVPLALAVARAPSPGRAAAAGLGAGFAYHAVVLHWVYQTCRFARVPLPVSALAWAALSGFLALNWAAAAALASWTSAGRSRSLRPLFWALSWSAVAFAAERWTPRLAADLLGYTQWPNLALVQCSSWGGPHLLGLAVILANAALAEAWLDAGRGRESGPSVAPLAGAFVLAAGLWAHGVWTLQARPADPGPTGRVEIVQPNVDQYQKWDGDFMGAILASYDELLSRPRPAPPRLVLWPETAVPRWTGRREASPEASRWAARLGAPNLIGIVARDSEGGAAANAAQLVGPDGAVSGFYAKRQLVPFGEFVPLRRLIPRFVVERWLGALDHLGDMEPGAPSQPLLGTAWGPAAVTICYEAMFPRWSRLDAARGARLLVNITNDGWYKDTWGPRQHFGVNVFRAVESRLPVLRAGNTGISAAIDPWGVVLARLELGERGRLDAELPLEDAFPSRSFYVRHGDWLGSSCLALAFLAALRRRPEP